MKYSKEILFPVLLVALLWYQTVPVLMSEHIRLAGIPEQPKKVVDETRTKEYLYTPRMR